MPITYQRDDVNHRILATSVGEVTLADTLSIINRQAAEGAWTYGVLYDTRQGINTPTAEEVHMLLRHVGKLTTRHGPRGPVALVVGDSPLLRIGQRYATLGELTALRVRIFTTLEEAEHWLDLEGS
jgi:hypothetical protein